MHIIYNVSSFFILFVYFLSFLFFLNFNSVFMIWILLEWNMIFFIFLVCYFSSSMQVLLSYDIFYYFIWQSLSTFFFLISLGLSEGSFYYLSSFIIIFFFFLKLGLPPLEFWMLKLVKFFPSFPLFILLSFSKLVSLMIFFFLHMDLSFFILMSCIVSSIFLFHAMELKFFLLYSSYCLIFWLMLSSHMNLFVFLFLLFIYFSLLYSVIFDVNFLSLFCYSFFSGSLPPFFLFFFKVLVFGIDFNGVFFIFSFIFTITCLVSYVKFSFSLWVSRNSFYYFYNKLGFLMLTIYFSIFISFFLIL